MLKRFFIICINFLIICISFAQEIQYKEKAAGDYTRFFYDDNYYLVDKYCEFKSIERVAQYDSIHLKFNGEFKDFKLNGRLLLHGFYKNGLKHGKFTAYHPNGQIKWESDFLDGKENGLWKYYYPDGKPMLTLSFANDDFRFLNYWDALGNQKLVEGEGEYEMLLQIKGFTDHGYTSYIRKGNISNGKPEGKWTTSFVTNEKRRFTQPIFSEQFVEGIQTAHSTNMEFSDYYIPYEDFTIVPTDFFSRAESFLVHGCTFDEYSGFLSFISRKFNDHLSDLDFESLNATFQYTYKYTIDNKGIPIGMKPVENTLELPKADRSNIIEVFESMAYFIPSILNGKPIRDAITLTGDFTIINNKAVLSYLKIEREKGQ